MDLPDNRIRTEPFMENSRKLKKLESARTAFTDRDADATRAAHAEYRIGGMEEKHQTTSSDYLRALVFGGLDGILTIFAIVAGCVGAQLGPVQIMFVGAGNLLADAISMGFGEYISAKAEKDFILSEKSREEWEVENCPEEEQREMVEIYTDKYGFSESDAQQMVDITFKYKTFFIQHMMVEELGLMAADDGPTPAKRGMVMFASFCLFGLVPLGGFLGWHILFGGGNSISAFLSACAVSLFTLFILGFFKGKFVGQNAANSGVLMTLNGGLAGGIAYSIGAVLQMWVQKPLF